MSMRWLKVAMAVCGVVVVAGIGTVVVGIVMDNILVAGAGSGAVFLGLLAGFAFFYLDMPFGID